MLQSKQANTSPFDPPRLTYLVAAEAELLQAGQAGDALWKLCQAVVIGCQDEQLGEPCCQRLPLHAAICELIEAEAQALQGGKCGDARRQRAQLVAAGVQHPNAGCHARAEQLCRQLRQLEVAKGCDARLGPGVCPLPHAGCAGQLLLPRLPNCCRGRQPLLRRPLSHMLPSALQKILPALPGCLQSRLAPRLAARRSQQHELGTGPDASCRQRAAAPADHLTSCHQLHSSNRTEDGSVTMHTLTQITHSMEHMHRHPPFASSQTAPSAPPAAAAGRQQWHRAPDIVAESPCHTCRGKDVG
jgi:hypothetical protein